MGHLQDSVFVDASPGQIWSWLTELAAHYTDWHPDHVSAEWEKGEPNQVGSVLKAVEHLGGHREELRFEMTGVDPPHAMVYRIRGPHSLLLPGGSFEISPHNGGSMFTARLRYRFGAVTAGLFFRRIAALRRHMREEGENLKRLVEGRR